MKKYLIWFFLLMKRMLKKPTFVLLLISLPLLAVIIDRVGQDGGTETAIGILIETKSQQDFDAYRAWNQQFMSLLRKQDSIFLFCDYENRMQLIENVETGKLDCGLVLPENLQEEIESGTWQEAITLYRTASSGTTEIVKERIASVIFTLYSEESYVNYVENTAAFETAEEGGAAREEIVAFARNAYEIHLLDGSTFSFQYHAQEKNGAEKLAAAPAFRLRGVLAVCIFLSGMCGLLTDWKDREEKRFLRMTPEWLTTIVNVWIPTIYTSVVTLVSLSFTGQFAGMGRELCHILFYQFLIVVYCSIIRLVLRRQEMIAAAIPILTLASMLCCPVWIRLAVYLPVFRVLERLFPATYYLLL